MSTILTPTAPPPPRFVAPVSAMPVAPVTAAPAVHKSRTKRYVILAILVLVALAVAAALRPKAVTVDVGVAAPGPMRVTVNADAVTRVVDHFAVSAPVTGFVQRITLLEGTAVRRGDVVAMIASSPAAPAERMMASARVDAATAARQAAVARYNQASSALAQAERDASRTQRLVDAGALADRESEVARVLVTSRAEDVSAARSQLRMADAELTQARVVVNAQNGAGSAMQPVRAPAPGSVLRVVERSARVVMAGAPLMEIGDPKSLEVTADVLSADASSIRKAQPVELAGWGGAPLRGIVRSVEPSARTRISALGVEEQRLTVVIDVVDAPPALGDGYRLDASITVWSAPKVLTAPASALLRDGNQWQAFVIRSGRAELQPVQVGHLGGGKAEITGGLRSGDSLVVFPAESLRDGARVKGAEVR